MITEDLKVSKLLDEYPAALEVMVSISPHFEKLRNVILRKTLASRVTLGQAAKIAGIPIPDMLSRLNRELSTQTGLRAKFCPASAGIPQRAAQRPEWLDSLSEENEVLFDARPLLASGQDPLKPIAEQARKLQVGEHLHLVNFFEPVPLYEVLRKRGFDHWTEEREGAYHIYFYGRWNGAMEPAPSECGPLTDVDLENAQAITELDVRGLQPPEPMVRVLESLPQIERGGVLLVHHHREPMFLYEKLAERGFEAACKKIDDNYYKVVIRKKS